ncbi:UDP-N-acetylglucosamine 2-epimerase [Povalibacter uvarum]|uniref:UDP-N-acetylglucosamine 2-epimerase n=1 Tax=Povalibacter uvarum TaxID=732238 RepID=A0A841HG42_9GAMM|nr:UDP-N-acetylglucosamine 2-epimerase (non-hydrolyzing) [Povalibacter uvarum]MBB6091653.1 UDP-N-acetylglucosamine 2-epimerase [Povalibacter uvarum]
MRLLNVVGARPQFVKLAPVCRAIEAYNGRNPATPVDNVILHTGQHYDPGLSDVFFEELEIPRPNVALGVGSGSHGQQTARMLDGIEQLLLKDKLDAVVVYGDTNSTIAAALAAVKLHIPVVHVEAGLRSFNRRMPEEINRIATDHVSDLLLAPTPTAVRNLEAERLSSRTKFTGDVMLDAIHFNREIAKRRSSIMDRFELSGVDYAVATVHRAENTDGPRLQQVMDALARVASDGLTIVLPLHPRTSNKLKTDLPQWRPPQNLRIVEPLGYLDMLRLVDGAKLVLTDSGGLQKEAFFLGKPCVTLRDETEWVETVEGGGNIVVGVDVAAILNAVGHWRDKIATGSADFSSGIRSGFGDGAAADHTIKAIVEFLQTSRDGAATLNG